MDTPRAGVPLRPLLGRRVLVTRPEGGGSLQQRLEGLGAHVLVVPATRIEWLDAPALDGALAALGAYGWAAFTSRNAVQAVVERLRATGRGPDALAGLRLIAVGSATAEALHARGLEVSVVPSRYSAAGILEALAERSDVAGSRVLYATAAGAADTLPDGLSAIGATVDRIACYQSVAAAEAVTPLREAARRVDAVTLTAPSAVAAWVAAVGDAAAAIPVVSIGPVTSDAARAAGLTVGAEAAPSTSEGLAEAVRRYFSPP